MEKPCFQDIDNDVPKCDICGIPTKSKWGVCQRTRECKRELDRRCRADNPQPHRDTVKQWKKDNPDRVLYNRQKYREIDRERARRWSKANPERKRETHRLYLQRTDRPCRYRDSLNCMEFAAIGGNTCRKHAVEDVMRRYYRKRNGLKQSLAEKQEFICTWCLKSLPDNLTDFYTHIDHIWPVSLGGPDEEWNLQILHYACNIRKGNKLTTLALEYIT